jgi:hypothetical protein
VYGPSSATGDINKFKQFFRDGRNTLSVDPLGFGPTLEFSLDLEGPDIIITRGEIVNAGADLELEGFMRDSSDVAPVLDMALIQVQGYASNGSINRSEIPASPIAINVNPKGFFCVGSATTDVVKQAVDAGELVCDPSPAVNIVDLVDASTSLLYSFTTSDANGYPSNKEYIADSEEIETLGIENAVRVAVGDSFVNSLRPLIAAGIYNILLQQNIEARGPSPTQGFNAGNF